MSTFSTEIDELSQNLKNSPKILGLTCVPNLVPSNKLKIDYLKKNVKKLRQLGTKIG